MSNIISETIKSIAQLEESYYEIAQRRLDILTKPQGSLGRLEEFARRMVAITRDARPSISKKAIFTFAGDHGVADEGVSAFPKEVTRQMVYNFLANGAGINVLARHAGAEVVVVDIGVDFDFGDLKGLVNRKVVSGTRNMRKGPAMTRAEVEQCIEAGISLARERTGPGAILGTGEMGIANTTASSAMTAVFTGAPVEDVTGRGTGIGDEAFLNKVRVIKDAIALNNPDPKDPIGVCSAVGGAEIAGIAGLILGCAAGRTPVVVDGFISGAGALLAHELCPATAQYVFASHNSVERGHSLMNRRMGLRPVLDLDLRLGEGTGAALAIGIIEASLKIYNEMATFGDAGVSEKK